MTALNPMKLTIARALRRAGVSAALLHAQSVLFRRHLRAVNYHDVPPSMADRFSEQLAFLARHYRSVGLVELEALVAGRWSYDRPGLILSFDDGLRSHGDVVAPLLRQHGLVGWFMVPPGFVDQPHDRQAEYAASHALGCAPEYPDPRMALTWDQIRDLDREGHVIGCHTMHHTRLSAELTRPELELEIIAAKRRLDAELGHESPVFAWVGGEEWSYSAAAAGVIRSAGFRYGFMTNNAIFRPGDDPLHIQRTNLEAHYPKEVVQFQISGLMDLLYAPRRRRVNRITA